MIWNIYGKAESFRDVLKNIASYKQFTKEEMRDFVHCNINTHKPSLLTNIYDAIDRIQDAFINNEKITIVGDYDSDGIFATLIMLVSFRKYYRHVDWIIPNRFTDGYGINKNIVDRIHKNNSTLIITVDNGINAQETINYANTLDIDVIVTDHHLPQNGLPTPICIDPHIDDSYPFKEICGALVAFKFCTTLFNELQYDEELLQELVSYAAIATVADAMPLIDENRFFVKKGVEYLNKTKNIGLKSLFELLKINNVTSSEIAYRIAPCFNATGRLESADLAVKLILEEDVKDAEVLAKQIVELNEKRKIMQNNVLENLEIDSNDNVIVVVLDDDAEEQHGISGVIAGRFAEKYNKPTIVLTKKENRLIGSCRSAGGFHIGKFIESHMEYLTSGGGHAAAAGLSFEQEKLGLIKEKLNQYYLDTIDENFIAEPTLEVMSKMPLSLIDNRLIDAIEELQPFGKENEQPYFMSENVFVDNYRIVGKNSNVIQMELFDEFFSIKSVGFSDIKEKYEKMNFPRKINIVYKIEYNEWPKNCFNPQVIIIDIKDAEL